jgi:Cys-tRNA(Pro)/Cys-tRNA(Cys) deacylase
MNPKDYEDKVKVFIQETGLGAKHHVFNDSCHSVDEAAKAAKTDPLDFIKSIVLISGSRTIVAIVKGEDRVSTKKVAKALELKERPSVATPEQVLERTGYPVGGVPPFGFEAEFLVDPRVMEKSSVWAGGGSDRSLITLEPGEIINANNAVVVRVRK